MVGERVTNDEARVDEVKAVVEKPAEAEKPTRTTYDDFVEGVASRDIALAEGAKPERMARVFQSSDKDGEPVVHLAGEGKVVSDIADVLERGGYRVQEWHIKRPDDAGVEAEKVRPALTELVRGMPPTIGTLEDIIREAKGLPLVEQPALTEGEAAKELGEALEGFSPGKQTREELEGKGED